MGSWSHSRGKRQNSRHLVSWSLAFGFPRDLQDRNPDPECSAWLLQNGVVLLGGTVLHSERVESFGRLGAQMGGVYLNPTKEDEGTLSLLLGF